MAALLAACPGDDKPIEPDAGPLLQAVAHLESKKGTVLVEREGKKSPAELGYLYVGDALETGPQSEARVRFHGGRIVELGNDARFVVSRDESGLLLEVARGLVLSRVPKDEGKPGEPLVALSIATPFGITRVGRGQNEVSIDVGAEGAKVEVLVGQVELLTRNGQALNASSGQSVSMSLGQLQLLGRDGPITLEPISVTLRASGGKAELRKKDSKKWKTVGKAGEALSEGDGVRVKSGNSTMELAGSPSRFTFSKGAELVFAASGRGEGLERAAMELKRGQLAASLAQGKKTQVLLGGLELTSDLGGQFTLAKTGDGYEVSAATGDLLLKSDGTEQLVRAGQSARLGKKGAKVQDIGREAFTLPSRGGLKVFHTGVDQASITWNGGAEKDFQVQVATDSELKNVLLSGLVHEPFLNVPVQRRGALYWKVTSADGAKEIDRGSATFAPEPKVDDLSHLRNEVAEGSDTATIYYQDQDKPPAVTFTYKPEEGAAKYRILVYKENALDKPVAERTVTEERAKLEKGELGEGAYRWSVTPISATGEELRGGNMSRLEIVYDNAVTRLVVLTPKNGDFVRRGSVDVAGIAPVGSRVFVNGKSVALDDKSRFRTSVIPVGTPPAVIFRLSQPSGAEVYTVRTLRRGK
ncbi:MAG: hypothetical protein ACOZIN_15225 [Myxococcota bacterium]